MPLCVLCGLFQIACGQKGPPLAPIVYLPRPVSEVIAKRVENEVVLQFTVPSVNTDNSGPADLRRIDVYAHTGPLPEPTDFLKYGTLVASIPIKQPPEPQDQETDGGPVAPKPDAEAAAKVEASGATGAVGLSTVAPEGAKVDATGAVAEPVMIEQGSTTAIREPLTPKHMEVGPMPPTRPVPPPDDDAPVVVVEKIETPGTVNFELPPQRFYAIVGVSESRGRRGPFAGPIPVALLEPLSPPEKVDVDYTADTISLTWPGQPEDMPTTATGATGATGVVEATSPAVVPQVLVVHDRETDGTVELYADLETEGTEDTLVAVAADPALKGVRSRARAAAAAPPPTPRFGYNVYELGATGATGAMSAPNAPTAPIAPNAPIAPSAPITPLNARLLTSPGFTDPRVEFGVERCYIIRRVEMVGAVAIESAPSSPTCVTPVDTFPPAPPKSLAHISGGSGVSLLWEANTEPDLGGYLVLRGEAPGDKLSPLTKAPITDTSFLDTTARRGRTYVYEVVAVDRSMPPNRSAPSNRVEETIR